MTDIEMTRLAAEAMGIAVFESAVPIYKGILWEKLDRSIMPYDPLHDDAQAMALVKKFHLLLSWNDRATEPRWEAQTGRSIGFGNGWPYDPPDGLNRAIVETVAKMRKEVRGATAPVKRRKQGERA